MMWQWLGTIRKALRGTLAWIRSRLTQDDFVFAVSIVRAAMVKFGDNAERREWAVTQLRRRGIPESLARWLVETALQEHKRQTGREPQPS